MQPWFRQDEDGRWSIEAIRSLATTLETAPVGALSGSATMIRDVADELADLRLLAAMLPEMQSSVDRILAKQAANGWADYPAAREGEG